MGYTSWGCFRDLLTDLALTETQRSTARGRISHVREVTNNRFLVATEAWATGSYSRDTVIRWNRDVDVMVALDDYYWSTYQADSSKFLSFVRDRINADYPNTKISSRRISIRIETGEDFQVDLVPAFVRDGGGFFIPDGYGSWLKTNPPYHYELVKDANVALDGNLKPLVRIMKAWNQANGHQLESFHLEMMLLEMWRSESAVKTWPEAAHLSLLWLPIWLRDAYIDPWTPGGRADAYLTTEARAKVLILVEGDVRRARQALTLEARKDYRAAIDKWNDVFVGRFPRYG